MTIGTLYKIMDTPSEDIFIDINDHTLFENPNRPFDRLSRMNPSDTQNDINIFCSRLKDKDFETGVEPHGKMLPYFVATQEATEKWFEERFHRFKDYVNTMNLGDFTIASYIFTLEEIITKTSDDHVLYRNEFGTDEIMPFDTFLREYAENGKTYYITDAVIMRTVAY